MDIERIVVRLVADASQYLRVLDSTQARLLAFGGFVGGYFSRQALTLAADYERAAVAFEVMTKSATTGRNLLNQINKLAIESPFTSAELRSSAKQVMAFGFETEDVIPIISRLGDVSVATGSDMDRLTLALGQVRTTGRLMGQELRQFTNAGVPILEYLAKSMGVSSTAVPQLVRQGKVSFSDVADAINRMTSEGGLFFGMMDRINRETVSGRWANLKESIQQTGMALGGAFFEAFRVREMLTSLGESVRGLSLEDAREGFMSMRLAVYSAWQALLQLADVIQRNRTAVMYFIGALLLLKAVSLVVSIATFILIWGQWAIAIGAVAVAIYGLVEALHALDVFEGIGERLSSGFEKLGPYISDSWKAIKDAIAGNDMELAFGIMMDTVKTLWRTTLALMEVEWTRFQFKVGNKIGGTALGGLADLADSLEIQGLGMHLRRLRRDKEAIGDRNVELQTNQIMKEMEKQLESARGRLRIMGDQAAVTRAFPKGSLGGSISSGIFDAMNRPDFDESAFRQSIIGPQKPGLGGMFQQAKMSQLLQDAIEKTMMVHGKILNPESNKEFDLKTLQSNADEAIKKLEQFQNTIKGVGMISKAFQIDANAVHAAAEARKEYELGTSALEKFQIQVGKLREAAEGPFGGAFKDKMNAFGAMGGMAGLMGNPGAQISQEIAGFGIFQAFKTMQKEVGGGRDRYAPAMLAGSREASDVIIRSRDQQLSVEQQVLQTLRDSKIVQEQQAKYSAEVVRVLSQNKDAARAAGIPGS